MQPIIINLPDEGQEGYACTPMQRQFLHQALPLLITVHAGARIEKVTLSAHPPGLACEIIGATSLSQEIFQFFENYLSGKPCSPPPLEWRTSTPFTRAVLHKLMAIPFGESRTYAQVAHSVGSPSGARAVGGACGRNPFPFFIPCHRVLAAGGKIGGFSAGLDFKKALLDHENVSY